MYLGKVSLHLLPQTGTLHPLAGPILYVLGFISALLLWSFGILFLFLALASIYISRPFPFNMGWWGFTFPLGVLAACTIQIGLELPSAFFRVLGTIISTAVVLLWIVVAIGTVRGAWSGKLFFAPCLGNLKKKEEEEEKIREEKLTRVA
jgi:tellurite resistance protein TehA-like permease